MTEETIDFTFRIRTKDNKKTLTVKRLSLTTRTFVVVYTITLTLVGDVYIVSKDDIPDILKNTHLFRWVCKYLTITEGVRIVLHETDSVSYKNNYVVSEKNEYLFTDVFKSKQSVSRNQDEGLPKRLVRSAFHDIKSILSCCYAPKTTLTVLDQE